MSRHEAPTHPPHLLAPAPRRPIQLVRAFRSATAPTSAHHHPYLPQHSASYAWDASFLPRRSSTTRPPSACSSAASHPTSSPPLPAPGPSLHPRSQSERTADGAMFSASTPSWRAKGAAGQEEGALSKVARLSLTDNGVSSNVHQLVTPLADFSEAGVDAAPISTSGSLKREHDPDLTPTRKQLQGMTVAAPRRKEAAPADTVDAAAAAAAASTSSQPSAVPSNPSSPEMRASGMLIPPSPISRLHTRNPFERQMQRLSADDSQPLWAAEGDSEMADDLYSSAVPERISVRSLRGMDRLRVDGDDSMRISSSPEVVTPTKDSGSARSE